MKRSTINILLTLVMPVCALPGLHAQEVPYKYSAGVGLGMSGYAGDASSSVFKHPGVAFDATFRYQYDARWQFGASFSTLALSGNTADMDGVLPGLKEYSFKSRAYDLGARVDFNFLPYGMGETYKGLRRFTPYLTVGLGVTLATCSGNSAAGPNIPLGMGVRYKLSERWNLQAQFVMTKVFNDHVDGEVLSDLTGIKSSFVKNNDWYSNLGVTVTYEFGRRCETCHYVD